MEACKQTNRNTSVLSLVYEVKIELKSLILAQDERWRHALYMQVERIIWSYSDIIEDN